MSDVKPAMTGEEWAKKQIDGFSVSLVLDNDGELKLWIAAREPGGFIVISRRDALAALCLHGEPFGFTREDVERLRYLARFEDGLDTIADRIEALLPPEGT